MEAHDATDAWQDWADGRKDIVRMQVAMAAIDASFDADLADPVVLPNVRSQRKAADHRLVGAGKAAWWKAFAVGSAKRTDSGEWTADPGAEIGACVLPLGAEVGNAVPASVTYEIVGTVRTAQELAARLTANGIAVVRKPDGKPIYLLRCLEA